MRLSPSRSLSPSLRVSKLPLDVSKSGDTGVVLSALIDTSMLPALFGDFTLAAVNGGPPAAPAAPCWDFMASSAAARSTWRARLRSSARGGWLLQPL